MRQLTTNNQSIREIAYFENRLLKCISWGVTDMRVEQAPPDVVLGDGIELTVALEPKVSRAKAMLALQRTGLLRAQPHGAGGVTFPYD
jgi:sensor c-di-GMP phosphodiesterase-like protein